MRRAMLSIRLWAIRGLLCISARNCSLGIIITVVGTLAMTVAGSVESVDNDAMMTNAKHGNEAGSNLMCDAVAFQLHPTEVTGSACI